MAARPKGSVLRQFAATGSRRRNSSMTMARLRATARVAAVAGCGMAVRGHRMFAICKETAYRTKQEHCQEAIPKPVQKPFKVSSKSFTSEGVTSRHKRNFSAQPAVLLA